MQAEKLSLPPRFMPKKFSDVASYNDEELGTLYVTESCCQPCAADSPLAVSNCHMLKFLAQLGHRKARRDSGLVRQGSSTDPAKADMQLGSGGPKPGNRFAALVAQVRDLQKAGGGSSAALQDEAASVTDARWKGNGHLQAKAAQNPSSTVVQF